MEVYATQETQTALKREFHYAFGENPYPGVPKINLNTITNSPFTIGGIELMPINVWHYKMPVKAFRIGNFSYITDANRIEEQELEKIKGSEIIVINALRKTTHISHFNLAEALELLERLKPKKAYLTHISHYLGKHDEVQKELPDYVEIAYDGLVINLNN
jgi:phosphoribosyl 1,2-cyclic phosphate phosphodiesterase